MRPPLLAAGLRTMSKSAAIQGGQVDSPDDGAEIGFKSVGSASFQKSCRVDCAFGARCHLPVKRLPHGLPEPIRVQLNLT